MGTAWENVHFRTIIGTKVCCNTFLKYVLVCEVCCRNLQKSHTQDSNVCPRAHKSADSAPNSRKPILDTSTLHADHVYQVSL